jgi:hypothetical protein
MSFFATIPAIDIKRLLPFLDFTDFRLWCALIRVEPISNGGCVLVATQGHYLATMRSQATALEAFSLQMSPRFAKALQTESLWDAEVVVESISQPAKIIRAGQVVYIHPGSPVSDFEFPQWRKVIPADEDLLPGLIDAFDPKYISRALRFVRWEGGDYDENSVRFFHKPDGPSVIRKRSMSVTVMPMKNQDFTGAGEWLKP